MNVGETDLNGPPRAQPLVNFRRLSAYLSLTKPRVTLMVVLTTLAGYYLALQDAFHWLPMFHTLFGTFLIAGGTAGANQVMEARADGLMRRTRMRPIPAGVLDTASSRAFSLGMCGIGALYLGVLVNPLTALLGIGTSALYLLVYTPLKTRTALCTAIGAIPGAIPPLMGWAAVRNEIDLQALSLFAILFLWQFPHFLSIAWIYREDYQRGGFRMLPIYDRQGRVTGRYIAVFALLLFGFSQIPSLLELTGGLYSAAALLLGLPLLWYSFRAAGARTVASARGLMRASVIYLPLLMLMMSVDKL